jgi:protein gp37
MATKISWTNQTWNPVTGCSKVSPGCAHCYAESLSLRFGWSSKAWTPENAQENVILHPERLEKPLSWRKPARVFVNSMSDLFHELVPFEFIDKVFAVMAAGRSHTFQVLTKRPERLLEYMMTPNREEIVEDAIEALCGRKGWCYVPWEWPLKNVWLGTSVENQHWADIRVPLLLQTPAAVRFLSCEPLLGPVDLSVARLPSGATGHPLKVEEGVYPISGFVGPLHWIIAGGESGPGYRAMDPEWARSLRDQCQAAGVAFFYKQSSGPRSEMNPYLDGVEYHQFPDALEASWSGAGEGAGDE